MKMSSYKVFISDPFFIVSESRNAHENFTQVILLTYLFLKH